MYRAKINGSLWQANRSSCVVSAGLIKCHQPAGPVRKLPLMATSDGALAPAAPPWWYTCSMSIPSDQPRNLFVLTEVESLDMSLIQVCNILSYLSQKPVRRLAIIYASGFTIHFWLDLLAYWVEKRGFWRSRLSSTSIFFMNEFHYVCLKPVWSFLL